MSTRPFIRAIRAIIRLSHREPADGPHGGNGYEPLHHRPAERPSVSRARPSARRLHAVVRPEEGHGLSPPSSYRQEAFSPVILIDFVPFNMESACRFSEARLFRESLDCELGGLLA